MSRPRIKLVISDFHLGAGPTLPDGGTNYLEDFFHDDKLVEFLDYHVCGEYSKAEVELVINGDFFNHLQIFPHEVDPALITERVALARTEAIFGGHPSVFNALARFAAAPHHSIVFMIGNHDVGLFYPAVQRAVIDRIGGQTLVHREPVYLADGIWIEHGSQRVAENWMDYEEPFLDGNAREPILKLPWGDLFVIRFLNRVKRKRPYIDKIYPFRLYLSWALIHDTIFALRTAVTGLAYFLQVLLRIGENKRFARQHFSKIAKEFSFPVKMGRAAKRIFAIHPDVRIVTFGHGHRAAAVQFAGGKEYFNTGIWNEMISMEPGTLGRSLRLTFLEIRFDKRGIPYGKLEEWKGAYHEVEEAGFV